MDDSKIPVKTLSKLPLIQRLNGLTETHPVVLGSGSPRRKEILSLLGLSFQILKPDFAEDLDKGSGPSAYVCATATAKAQEIYDRLLTSNSNLCPLVIGSDTIVVLDNEILEKPLNAQHARSMMEQLSGKSHTVLTAVCILAKNSSDGSCIKETLVESTTVTFSDLNHDMIQVYIDSGEPFDKAGGYGYQGLASFMISKIDGCYYNVVGFPAFAFLRLLERSVKKAWEAL